MSTLSHVSPADSFFAHHGAWAPGVRMFRVMGFKAKAAWISAAFLLPLMLVFGVYLRNQLAAEAFAKAEVQGVAALKAYLPLLRSVLDWRDTARAAEAGVDLKAELGNARQRTERAMAAFAQHLAETGDPLHFAPAFAKVQAAHQLAAAAPRPIDAAGENPLAPLAEAVMAAQVDLGDKSNLTLDPDADSFYTQAALVMELPGLASDLGHLRAWATYLNAKGLDTPKLLRRYIGWDHGVLVRSQTVADDLKRAVDATPAMGAALDAKPLATVLAFRQHAARVVLDGEAGDAKQLWGEAATAMDALFSLCDRGLPALDAALAKRIDGLVTERRALLAALALSLLAAAYLFASFYRVMHGGLAEVRHHLRAMTDGDLTTEPRPWGRDEAATLMLALQAMQGSLRSIVGQVRGASDSIVVASGEIAAAAVDLSTRTERTAADLEQSASAMEEISSTVRHTAGNAKEVAGLAAGNAEAAARGGEVIGRVVSTMQEIQGSSQQIADIVGVIDSIAFQTNILALNAAVEAARAGEQGRGFAVVASEVRALAQRSAGAAREIKGLISASVGRVDSGMHAVQGAGTTMQELVGNAQRMNLLLAEISVVANQQSVGVTQVGATVQNLDQMTQQNAALVEQASAAASTMNAQAKDLAHRVSIFKLPLAA